MGLRQPTGQAARLLVATGLSWAASGDRTRTESDMTPWIGKRAGVGKLPPHGFPRDNRFT